MAKIVDILARGSELVVRVLPAEDARGRGAARAGARSSSSRCSPSFVSVTYGAGGSTRETHPRPRRAHQPRHVDDRHGAPHVRGARARRSSSRSSRATATPASRTSWRSAAIRPRISTCRPASSKHATELVALDPRASATSRSASRCIPKAIPRRPTATTTGAARPRSSRVADFGLSQFFFEADVWFEFLGDLDALGVTTPVIPGIMPVTNAKSVKRMSEMAGAEFPGWLEQRLRAVEDDDDGDARGRRRSRDRALPRPHGRRRRLVPLLHAEPLDRDARDLRQLGSRRPRSDRARPRSARGSGRCRSSRRDHHGWPAGALAVSTCIPQIGSIA